MESRGQRRFPPAAAVLAAALATAPATLADGGAKPAFAQMQLPGAIGSGVGGKAVPARRSGGGGSAAPSSYAPPKPVIIKAPGQDTVVGHPLSRDGAKGEMVLAASGDGLALAKLVLSGETIGKPGSPCVADVPLAAPLLATPVGRPAGANRFSVAVPACALTLDILDGAVLVTRPEPSCDLTAAECRVSPVGLWGPPPAAITPKRAKDLERERVRFETTMRANFRALLRKAGKDTAAVKSIAKDQAAFSSEREMTCRDYAQEAVHGFCSTEITEARALALMAQFETMPEGPHGRRARGRRPGDKAAAVPAR